MKNSHLLLIGSLLMGVLAAPASAAADSPPPDCSDDPACLTLKEQAAERSKSGDLPAALRLYQLAYEVRADPRLLFNIARVLHRQGQVTEAMTNYRRFIDAPLDDAAQKKKAQEYLGQIQATNPPTTSAGSINLPTASVTPSSISSHPVVGDVSAKKPVYKKWWFWTALGGGALAITAIGLGVGLSKRQASVSTDINTYEPTF